MRLNLAALVRARKPHPWTYTAAVTVIAHPEDPDTPRRLRQEPLARLGASRAIDRGLPTPAHAEAVARYLHAEAVKQAASEGTTTALRWVVIRNPVGSASSDTSGRRRAGGMTPHTQAGTSTQRGGQVAPV